MEHFDWYQSVEQAIGRWDDRVAHINMNNYFDERFMRRDYGKGGLYSYELEWILEYFSKTFEIEHYKNCFGNKPFTKMVVYIETERSPNFIETLPILDRIQELYPFVELMCVHHDWKEYESKYIKIPSHIWAFEALEGIQPWAGDYITIEHKLTKEDFMQSNDIERDKLFMCTNKTRRYHKDELINFIRQNNLEDKGMISIRWENITLEDSYQHLKIGKNPMQSFYNNVFCDLGPGSMHDLGIGYFESENIYKPFGYCVIPMVISWPDCDKPLRKLGLDLFDDIIDTSFYQEGDLDKKFEIIKNNLYIIENECVEHKKFKDNIWERLLENNIKIRDNLTYVNYVKKIINENR